MFFDINRSLCTSYNGLDPLRLLDYPAEEVFELIEGMIDYNRRESEREESSKKQSRRRASDDWF